PSGPFSDSAAISSVEQGDGPLGAGIGALSRLVDQLGRDLGDEQQAVPLLVQVVDVGPDRVAQRVPLAQLPIDSDSHDAQLLYSSARSGVERVQFQVGARVDPQLHAGHVAGLVGREIKHGVADV